ncbi:MAG: hypothetical protein FWC15_08265, partial [Fibromonadales bacterium]|nr:hypothetical protein [Fibromonadales bacterium]
MFVNRYSAYYSYLGNFQEPPVEGLFFSKKRCPPLSKELSQHQIREVLRKATDCEARSFLANYALFNVAKSGNAQGFIGVDEELYLSLQSSATPP